jgi:hypothetical protein
MAAASRFSRISRFMAPPAALWPPASLLLALLVASSLTACPGSMDGSLGGSDSDGSLVGGDAGASGDAVVKPVATSLQLEISSPARGATLDGAPTVTVQGKVIGKASGLTLNGAALTVAADGSFSSTVQAVYGMNVLILAGKDEQGTAQKLVQSFYYSTRWLKSNPGAPKAALLDNAVQGWLGAAVFDSGGARIDIAEVIERKLKSINVAALVPSSQRINNVIGCDYVDITISNVSVGPATVSLTTSAAGLKVKVRYANLRADVKGKLSGKWYNPACLISVKGTVKASAVEVTTTIQTSVSKGKLSATAKQTAAKVHGFDIKISGIWGFLTNWLVNRFEGDLARDLETMVTGEINKQVGPALAGGIGGLAFDEVLEVPSLVGNPATSVTLVSQLSALTFEQGGARYALEGTAVAQPLVTHPSLGSMGYACGASGFSFSDRSTYPMQLAISDDLINQLLYSFHRGGLLNLSLSKQEASELLGSIAGAGITDLQASLDALLPPVINTCKQGGPVLQIGDLRATLDFKLLGQPVQMEVHVALEAPLAVEAKGDRLKLSVSKPTLLEIESKDLTAGGSKVFKAVRLLLDVQLVPKLTDLLNDKSISVPIPKLDLQQMDPTLGAGATVQLKVSTIVQRAGYTVAQGSIQ